MLLMGGLLVLVGTASSRFSSRFGVPLLLLFIGVGMAAGSEGIGGVQFSNYHISNGIATLALAVILFDGGLRTSIEEVRPAAIPALVLATAGVIITAAITGFAARALLGLALLPALLLGSIVASTDAAAVFTVLRGSGLNLPRRVNATLELESGLNDPMAVFLTIGLLEVLLGRMTIGSDLLYLFVKEMALGAIGGILVGRFTVWLINRIDMDAPGLYPVMTLASGIFAFGLAARFGGSGFLSVYLAGICVGNARIAFKRGVLLFMDGAAWLAQITMFVLLGLLSFPTRILHTTVPAVLITAVLIILARPVAVFATLLPFRFATRELVLISWSGLKGAVPIVLATYPLLEKFPGSERLFDVVFFVVLLSTAAQVWTLPWLARRLKLDLPGAPAPPVALEITSVHHLGGDIVDYPVGAESRLGGRRVRDLMLPEDAVVAMIARGTRVIPPRGSSRIEAGDHVFLVLTPAVRPLVDKLFSSDDGPAPEIPVNTEFPIAGSATVAELDEFYGIVIDAPPSSTLDELLRARLGARLGEGRGITIGALKLRVRDLQDGHVIQAGVEIISDDVMDLSGDGQP
jgi:cell volume regulation protein A